MEQIYEKASSKWQVTHRRMIRKLQWRWELGRVCHRLQAHRRMGLYLGQHCRTMPSPNAKVPLEATQADSYNVSNLTACMTKNQSFEAWHIKPLTRKADPATFEDSHWATRLKSWSRTYRGWWDDYGQYRYTDEVDGHIIGLPQTGQQSAG